MTTLREHRQTLENNNEAYGYDVNQNMGRLIITLRNHWIVNGIKVANDKPSLDSIVRMLFDSQDRRPIFYVEGTELPLCWNQRKDWDLPYIKYEWGHLKSKHSAPSFENDITNLALYSGRCNQHIQSGLNIEELMIYGGILAQRISNVLTKRRLLFESDNWKEVLGKLNSKS